MDAEGLCPCCRQVKETVVHVYQCTEPITVANRVTLLTNLERDCERRQIPDPVKKVLLLGLQWFLNDPISAPPTPLPLSTGIISPQEAIAHNAFHAQTLLGWDHVYVVATVKCGKKLYCLTFRAISEKIKPRRWCVGC